MKIRPPPIVEHFKYEALPVETLPSGIRHYVTPEGFRVPSVTTILDKMADKEGLVEWRKRVGDVAADKAKRDGTTIGSLVHHYMEDFVLDRPRDTMRNIIHQMTKRMADTIIEQGMPRVNEVWGVEAPLYISPLYAGTSDIIGLHDGQEAIVDFKNAKKLRSKDMILDYFRQMGAYRAAHNDMFGTNIRKGVIMMVSRTYEYREFIIEGEEFDRYTNEFFDLAERYHTEVLR